MAVKYEIKAKAGEANGKPFYQKIGVVLEGDKGFSIKLNVIPLGWDGFAFLSEPENRAGTGGSYSPRSNNSRSSQRPPQGEMDDDIPF